MACKVVALDLDGDHTPEPPAKYDGEIAVADAGLVIGRLGRCGIDPARIRDSREACCDIDKPDICLLFNPVLSKSSGDNPGGT